MQQVPFWFQIIQGLGPLAIAAMVGYVAYRQWRTARDRLRFDLFEKRYVIYERIQTIIIAALSAHPPNSEEILDFYRGTRGVEFLFGPEIEIYLGELRDSLGRLAGLQRHLALGQTQDPNYTVDLNEVHEMKLYFERQLMIVMRAKFIRYLSLARLT